MSNEIKAEATPFHQAGATQDLSEAIQRSVEKEPGEEARSVRLFDDYYRCNWWIRDKSMGPAYLNLGTISRSKFLRATMTGEKLVIEDLSSRPK
jgi:hypothetical protein